MNIELANENDIDLLTQMNIELRKDEKIDNIMTNAQVKERMIKRLSTTYKAYLFYHENKIYGYALIDHNPTPLYLCQIFIINEYRSKGFGESFFKELMKFLNLKEIDVGVLNWNEKAQKFYKKIGFYPRFIGLRYKVE